MNFLLIIILSLTLSFESSFQISISGQQRQQQQEDVPYIVGGEDVLSGKAPHQVAIYSNGQFICAGSLIALRTVLTAAHCVLEYTNGGKLSAYKLHYGSNNYTLGTQIGVTKIVSHPRFSAAHIEYDLAILHLESPIKPSPDVAAIIALATKSPAEGTILTVTGWGKLSANGTFPQALQIANTLKVVSEEYCKHKWSQTFNITDGIICAMSATQSACNKDSGGSVTLDGVLVGVVSFGPDSCLGSDKPNGYADVAHHLAWIRSNIVN